MLDRLQSSARWQRAAHDAQRGRPWIEICAALALAAIVWTIPAVVAGVPSIALDSMRVRGIATLAGLLVGWLAAPPLWLAWHYWRAPVRIMEDLAQRVATLEQSRHTHPAARVRFEYDSVEHRVRLHITNYGAAGEFWASLTVDGAVPDGFDGTVFAKWAHSDESRTLITKGQTCTLCLAQLDLATFPFALWRLHVIRERGRPAVVSGSHASLIGGAPNTLAPTIMLEVSLLSDPDLIGGVRIFKIALHPFSAERVG